MKKILEFHGNGSVVEVEGIKRQAGEAPSPKHQATSSKHAKRATNCRASICPIDKSLKLQAPSRKRQACDKLPLRHYVTLTQYVVVRQSVFLCIILYFFLCMHFLFLNFGPQTALWQDIATTSNVKMNKL